MKAKKQTMKTITCSNWWPLRRALGTLLMGIATLWVMPTSVRAQLYVTQSGNTLSNGTVGEYDATTGAVINANFAGSGTGPTGLALLGNSLFALNNPLLGTVSEYNATTGAVNNAAFISGLSTSSINGIAVASVPEPSTWSMIAVGGVALLGMMHRKKHRAA
jgi:hypothetical protein